MHAGMANSRTASVLDNTRDDSPIRVVATASVVGSFICSIQARVASFGVTLIFAEFVYSVATCRQ